MKKIDILYLYEHVVRELDVACAVKCIAERLGLQIEIAHWKIGLEQAFSKFQPRIIVLPHCIDVIYYQSIVTVWRKSVFVNLAWEQLLCEETIKQKRPNDDFTRKHVIHHAWGDFYADFLREEGVPTENIFINGNPSYMLYEEPYRQYFKQRIDLSNQYKLDTNKRWIFFPENYAWAFISDVTMKALQVDRGTSLNRANTMRQFTRQSMEETMKWCDTIVRNKNIELIIRPRPSIPLKEFINKVHETIRVVPDNMHFIKEESIREWIMASDVVISSYSTSLVDAAIAGKPAYLIEPYPIPKYLHVDWHNYITHIRTQEELENTCVNHLPLADNNRLDIWARASMLMKGDAIWNLSDFLVRLCHGDIRHPPYPSRKILTNSGRFPLPKWALFEYRKIRYKNVRRNEDLKNNPLYENDYIHQGEIEQKIKNWKRILKSHQNCN